MRGEGGEEPEDVAGGRPGIDAAGLQHDAEPRHQIVVIGDRVEPQDAGGAGIGRPEALTNLQQAGLTGAVVAQQSQNRAARDGQRNATDGNDIAVLHDDVLHLDGSFTHGRNCTGWPVRAFRPSTAVWPGPRRADGPGLVRSGTRRSPSGRSAEECECFRTVLHPAEDSLRWPVGALPPLSGPAGAGRRSGTGSPRQACGVTQAPDRRPDARSMRWEPPALLSAARHGLWCGGARAGR
jgi:hypothetical protein